MSEQRKKFVDRCLRVIERRIRHDIAPTLRSYSFEATRVIFSAEGLPLDTLLAQ
jgi:hypothetical protein